MNAPEWNIDVLLVTEELERELERGNFDYIAYRDIVRITKGNIRKTLEEFIPILLWELNLVISDRNIEYLRREFVDFSKMFNKYCKKRGIKYLEKYKVKDAFKKFIGWRRYMKRYVMAWIYNHK